ncbi:MAG: hypothetical protein Q8K58_12980 [Acidimicrobiales bacterium]|nr:hypothetical protein [Acidimicrobiales bacterium]
MTPTRVLETRGAPFETTPANAVKAGANSITKVKVRGTGTPVPSTAPVAVATVTGVESTGTDGYLTVWDCADMNLGDDTLEPDPPANVSNVNLTSNDIRPNTVISKVGASGAVAEEFIDHLCIYSRNATHLLVDVTGYFRTGSGDYVADEAPHRYLDTRPSGGGVVQTGYAGGKPTANQVHHFTVGGIADAIVLNVAGVASEGGYVTIWDCHDNINGNNGNIEPDPPLASSLNLENGVIAANLVITKSADAAVAAENVNDGIGVGDVCFYTSNSTHLIADRFGYFPDGASYAPLDDPLRVLETRPTGAPIPTGGQIVNTPANTPKPVANGRLVLNLEGKASPGQAVVLNVTGTATEVTPTYVTVYPCQSASTPVPETSNLNLVAGQTRANLVITQVGNESEICFFTQHATHLVADLLGVLPAPS